MCVSTWLDAREEEIGGLSSKFQEVFKGAEESSSGGVVTSLIIPFHRTYTQSVSQSVTRYKHVSHCVNQWVHQSINQYVSQFIFLDIW